MKVFIFCFLLCIVGCARKGAESVGLVAQTNRSAIVRKSNNSYGIRSEAVALIKEVDVMPDKILALNKICEFVDKVINLDVSNYGYDQQRMILQDAYNVFIFDGSVVYKAAWFARSTVLVYDLQIKVLHWQRKQIERLQPQKDVIFREMDVETQEKYSNWRDCYVTIVASFEQSIRKIEDILVEFREKISVQEFERIKGKLKQLNQGGCDVFNLEGVISREVGPIELM